MLSATALRLRNVYKSYREQPALKGISFDVYEGETLALLGPSGCGKSTLLAVIAGLEAPDRGNLEWDGVPLENTPPHARGFGLMFQDYALFPHMNVFENVAFGLRMTKLDERHIQKRVMEVLQLVGLSGFEKRDINNLSGGEQQRVALARSLAPQPRLLMLDEPMGSIDRTLRERLLVELRQILRTLHLTTIYVTHDQEEAFAIADRIVLMKAGQIEQVDTPQRLYRHPATVFVAHFLGMTNILSGEVHQIKGGFFATTAIGNLPIPMQKYGKVTILLRPDSAYLDGQGDYHLTGNVTEISFRGGYSRMVVTVEATPLEFDFHPSASLPNINQTIHLSFEAREAIQVFDIEEQTKLA